ncbi:hypothetical protein E2C01_053886 [Portunus trituberculatus]|uniref:Uncharacterized protein n=1 Tax=Portunus trituberculatus TaxID=210409 RepID=A0A5B7GS16_PORTR|nr:hypothetical protein [Portunus trituberculatus]
MSRTVHHRDPGKDRLPRPYSGVRLCLAESARCSQEQSQHTLPLTCARAVPWRRLRGPVYSVTTKSRFTPPPKRFAIRAVCQTNK